MGICTYSRISTVGTIGTYLSVCSLIGSCCLSFGLIWEEKELPDTIQAAKVGED